MYASNRWIAEVPSGSAHGRRTPRRWACIDPSWAALRWVTLVLLVGGFSATAAAQTGTNLLTDPWASRQRVAFEADWWRQEPDVETGGADVDSTIIVGRTRTRLRLSASDERVGVGDARPPAFGHEYTHVDFDADDPRVPDRLVRQEAALGLALGDQVWGGATWRPGVVLGVGHASTNPFGDGDGWYALASLFAQHNLSDGSTLLLGLSFDGNRSVFPDLPLPIFEYRTPLETDPLTGRPLTDGASLGVTIGYPEARIVYRPNDQLELSAGWDNLDWATAELRYQATDVLAARLAYAGFYDMFHDADDPDTRRLYFLSQRIEAGVILTPTPGIDLTFTGGYTFGQELRRGYDWRETDRLLEFADAPFFRVGLEMQF
jgi:hypothetical protein